MAATKNAFGVFTGTTAASASAGTHTILNAQGCGSGHMAFLVKNLGSSNGLSYKIDGYLNPNSSYSDPVKAAANVAASAQAVFKETTLGNTICCYPKIVITIYDQVDNSHTTYQIDWCTV
jgi:hypothetical protein